MRWQALVSLAVLILTLWGAWPVAAQAPVTAPSSGTAQESSQADQDLAWLIAILQDETRRTALLKELNGRHDAAANAVEQTVSVPEPAPEPEAASLVVSLSDHVRDISERALRLTASLQDVPRLIGDAFHQMRNPDIRAARLNALWHVLGALAVGLAIEWLVARSLAGVYRRFDQATPATVLGRAIGLIVRAVIDAIPVAAFIAATLAVGELIKTPHRAELATILLIYAHVSVRASLIAARVLVAPETPNLRLLTITDETAEYLYIWIRRIAVVAIYGLFIVEAARFFGLTAAARMGLIKTVGGVVTLLLIIFVLQNRTAVARAIANEHSGVLLGIRKALADVWHVLAILYLVGLFGVWLFDIPGGFDYVGRASIATIVIVAIAWLLIGAMKQIVGRMFRLNPDLTHRFPGLETRANRYMPVFREGLRGVILGFAFLMVLQVWGVHSLRWVNSQTGIRVIGTLIAVGLVLLAALVVWEAFSMALERYTERLVARGSSGARARTLLPLFRTTTFIVLAALVGLVVLTQIGINITPLLAGAGVIGLAVGFGSQKLVQDFINGVFILIEDTIAVGDTVDLGGGHVGVVEGISIRTIRLRDGNGTIHTIPFSEVKTVNNMTRDFSKSVFEIEVSYRENIERVIAAIREVGEAVAKEKVFASTVVEPFTVIGVDKVKGSGVVVLAQITTLPGKQWDITRAFNRALKIKFDELGIEMPTGRASITLQNAPSEKDEPAAPGTEAKPA